MSGDDFEADLAAWYAGLTPEGKAEADTWGDWVEARVMMGDASAGTPHGLLVYGELAPWPKSSRGKRPPNPPHLFGGRK